MAKKKQRTVVITKHTVDIDNEPLRFGKYKGKTPNQIAKEDPGYIIWMSEKIPTPPMTRDLVLDCESLLADRDPEADDEAERSTRDDYQYGRD